MLRRHLAPAVVMAAGLAVPAAAQPAPSTAAAPPAPSAATQRPERPNIVLVTTDDQAEAEMFARIDGVPAMPTVRGQLRRKGATFVNSLSPYPLCCPARASILTGQYPHNHGVLGNQPPWGGFPALQDENTVATWLQEAGYNTAFVGKYLNAYGKYDQTYVPPGWSDWHASVRGGTHNYQTGRFNHNGVVRGHREYRTTLIGSLAVSAVERWAPAERPFFLWASHLAPHTGKPVELDDPAVVLDLPGWTGPAVEGRYHDLASGLRYPRRPDFNEADVSDKPRHIQELPRLTRRQRAAVEEIYQQRLEALRSVDDAIRRLLQALRASGELANTLVIFTSDNGYMSGQHRSRGKTLPYEPSSATPLVVRGPGIPRGVSRRQPVATIDLAPTIAAAAGSRPDLTTDGRSLLPLAKHPHRGLLRDLVLEAGPRADTPDMFYRGLRTKGWTYVEYDTGERELYNLYEDPWQLRSVHAKPAYADIRRQLAARLAELRDCTGRGCR